MPVADAMVPRMTNPTAVRALRARPLAVVAILIAAAAFVNALLVGCGGSQSNSGGETQTTTSTPETTTPPAGGTTTAAATGAEIYSQRCALCHGAEGKGDGPASAGLNPKPRNHTDGSYMNHRTEEELLGVIREGKGAMPAWKAVLTEEEIQKVLKHVRTLAVPPYTGS